MIVRHDKYSPRGPWPFEGPRFLKFSQIKVGDVVTVYFPEHKRPREYPLRPIGPLIVPPKFPYDCEPEGQPVTGTVTKVTDSHFLLSTGISVSRDDMERQRNPITVTKATPKRNPFDPYDPYGPFMPPFKFPHYN